MSDVLTVPTHFADISELASGLADRVDEGKVILYGPDAYEEGAVIGFAILLADGTAAFEGQGRVVASIDGGEDRAPETRYDVVLDSLELDGRAEVVYERILLAGGQGEYEGGRPTGEVSIEDLEAAAAMADAPAEEEPATAEDAVMDVDPGAADVEMAPAGDAAPEEPAGGDEWADVGGAGELEAVAAADEPAPTEEAAAADDTFEEPSEPVSEEAVVAAMDDTTPMADATVQRPVDREPPQPPPAPAPFEVARMGTNGHALTRPSQALSWEPEAVAEPEAGPESELFAYAVGELPVPPVPPRPELDSSYRVRPAPRPGAEGAVQAVPVLQSAPEAAYGAEDSEPPEAIEEMDDLVEMADEEREAEWD
jgi:hypothetical protein